MPARVGHLYFVICGFLPVYLCIANSQGYIVVGYRGTFAFGRDMSDVKFRKLNRILVHGKVGLCKEVFKVIKWSNYLLWTSPCVLKDLFQAPHTLHEQNFHFYFFIARLDLFKKLKMIWKHRSNLQMYVQ